MCCLEEPVHHFLKSFLSILQDVWDIESERTTFKALTVEAAVSSCPQKVTGACWGGYLVSELDLSESSLFTSLSLLTVAKRTRL